MSPGRHGGAGLPLESEVELIMAELWELGTTGISELPSGNLIAGFDHRDRAERAVTALTQGHTRARRWHVAVEPATAPQDWGDDQLRTVEVGVGGGSAGDRPGFTVSIRAGTAFGHGGHATTRLILNRLVAHVPDGGSVLDVGTGTGVLAIVAAMAGASRVVGVDVDPEAVEVARQNAAGNPLPAGGSLRFTTETVDHVHRTDGPFDLIVMNTLLPVHRELAVDMLGAMGPDGTLLTSGYLRDQAHAVEALYGRSGRRGERVASLDHFSDGDWSGHRMRFSRSTLPAMER